MAPIWILSLQIDASDGSVLSNLILQVEASRGFVLSNSRMTNVDFEDDGVMPSSAK